MANNITINVRAVVDKAVAEVDQLKAKLNNLSTSEGFKSAAMGVGMGAGIAAFGMVKQALGEVGGALSDAAQAAMADEESQTRLRAALQANVPAWAGNTAAIEETIKARMRLGFSDEEQRTSLAVLVAKTGDATMALQIQGAAMDLARLKGIDLAEASKAIALGMSGSGRALKELGINVKDYASASEILVAIQGKAAGQAETFGKTTAGAMQFAKIQIDEAWEAVGVRLLPVMKMLATDVAPAAASAIAGIAEAASNTAREVDNLTSILKTLAGTNVGPDAKAPQFEISPASVYGEHLGPALANMGWLGPANQEAEARRQFDAQQRAEQVRRINEAWTEVGAVGSVASASAAVAMQASYEAAMRAGQANIRNAIAKNFSDTISAELTAGAERANGIASAWSEGLGARLGAGEPGWITALNALGTDMKSSLTKSAQAGYILAALNSKAIQTGLSSGKPGIAAETAAVVNTMLVTLDQMYGPAYLASYNFGSGIVNAAARAIAAGQMKAFGNASPGMAPIVPKVIAPITSAAGDPGFKAIMDQAFGAATAIGGGGGGGASSSISAAATDAKAKLKQLADDAKSNLGTAFDRIKTSARTFFDDLHNRNRKAIDDTRDLKNAQLDAQIGSINANVQAARDALQATRDARSLASLQNAVGTATDPAAQEAAQQALSDFQAEQAIKAMEKDAQTKIDGLTLQKKANDDAATAQTIAEDERYKAQTTAYDKEMAALQAYLDKHPAAWKKTSDDVLKLLLEQGVNYAAAGAFLGSSFATGLAGDEKGLQKSAQAYGATSKAAGGSVVINVNGAGDPAAVAEAIMQALQREKQRQNMSLA